MENLYFVLPIQVNLNFSFFPFGFFLFSYCFIAELVPGVRITLVDEGALPKLIQLSLEGKICLYRKLERKDLEMGELIAKGAGGVVYRGKWNDK